MKEAERLQVDQLKKNLAEREDSLANFKSENEKLRSELESVTTQRNELSEVKLELDKATRAIELLQKENESYKQSVDKLSSENSELREVKLNNGKDITEYKFKNEQLMQQLEDKKQTILDKQEIIDNQKRQIEKLSKDNYTLDKNFRKCKSKLETCASEIDKGNELLADRKQKITKLKESLSKSEKERKEIQQKYDGYYSETQRELEDLRKKAELCKEQKNQIDFLQKKLTSEQMTNHSAASVMNNTSSYKPSFNPPNLSNQSSSRPGLPKSSSTYQPVPFKSSFASSERPIGAGADRYSMQNPQMTPSRASPFSRDPLYTENKTLNGTPSSSSVHSINISGMPSVHSSYQVHCPNSASNYTASFKKEEVKDQENKSPNAMAMSLVHTTKPAPRQSSEMMKTTETLERKSEDE